MLVSLQRTHQNLKPPGSSQNWSEDLALRLRILTEVRAKSLTFASPARQEEGPEGPEGPRRGPHGRTTMVASGMAAMAMGSQEVDG